MNQMNPIRLTNVTVQYCDDSLKERVDIIANWIRAGKKISQEEFWLETHRIQSSELMGMVKVSYEFKIDLPGVESHESTIRSHWIYREEDREPDLKKMIEQNTKWMRIAFAETLKELLNKNF